MSTRDKLIKAMLNGRHLSVVDAENITSRGSGAGRRLREIGVMFECRKYWEDGKDSRYMVYALTAKGKAAARKYLGVKNG